MAFYRGDTLTDIETQLINKRFAESIYSRLNMRYCSHIRFKEILQFSNDEFADLMAGNLDWKTRIGFEKLDTILGNSPGYWESVYSNILHNYQTDKSKSDFDGDVIQPVNELPRSEPILKSGNLGNKKKISISIEIDFNDPRLSQSDFDIRDLIESLDLNTDIKLNAMEKIELQKEIVDLFGKYLDKKLRPGN